MAKLCAAGVTLRSQVDDRWPDRDKASDGWIGDAAHSARDSDHNPDENEIVHAIDLDEDFGEKGAAKKFADELIRLAREGKDGGRLKYVVYEDRIASGTYRDSFWTWRGSGFGHTQHVHVSFTNRADRNGEDFLLPILGREEALWDGKVPPFVNVLRAFQAPDFRSIASFRVACRLSDLGFYEGADPVRFGQGFPVKAYAAWAKAAKRKATGYTVKDHAALFGVEP